MDGLNEMNADQLTICWLKNQFVNTNLKLIVVYGSLQFNPTQMIFYG